MNFTRLADISPSNIVNVYGVCTSSTTEAICAEEGNAYFVEFAITDQSLMENHDRRRDNLEIRVQASGRFRMQVPKIVVDDVVILTGFTVHESEPGRIILLGDNNPEYDSKWAVFDGHALRDAASRSSEATGCPRQMDTGRHRFCEDQSTLMYMTQRLWDLVGASSICQSGRSHAQLFAPLTAAPETPPYLWECSQSLSDSCIQMRGNAIPNVRDFKYLAILVRVWWSDVSRTFCVESGRWIHENSESERKQRQEEMEQRRNMPCGIPLKHTNSQPCAPKTLIKQEIKQEKMEM